MRRVRRANTKRKRSQTEYQREQIDKTGKAFTCE